MELSIFVHCCLVEIDTPYSKVLQFNIDRMQKKKYGKKLRRYSADAIYNFTRMNRPKRVRCLDWNVQLSHKLISTRNLSRMTKSFSNQLK